MKIQKLLPSASLLAGLTHLAAAEALIDSWHTSNSGSYARIWATQAQEITERGGGAISSLTTWDSADYTDVAVGDQPLPVYAGVQGISYSADYVYIKSTGLATNTMGPWFLDADRSTAFPSFPGNAAILYRFPRVTDYPEDFDPATRTPSAIGTNGLFVDGVPLFNTGDTFSYDSSAGADQEPTNNNNGDGYWNRDAFINEGITFAPGMLIKQWRPSTTTPAPPHSAKLSVTRSIMTPVLSIKVSVGPPPTLKTSMASTARSSLGSMTASQCMAPMATMTLTMPQAAFAV